jgi:hypothetical protein
LTLNPLDHLDPVGTLLPILGIPFGWVKPVPINPLRFHSDISMSTGLWITAIAGPISNVVIAVGCGIPLKLMVILSINQNDILPKVVFEILWNTLLINLMLAMFNMLPHSSAGWQSHCGSDSSQSLSTCMESDRGHRPATAHWSRGSAFDGSQYVERSHAVDRANDWSVAGLDWF